MGLMTEICFRLARRRVLSRRAGDAGQNAATFDADAYRGWRWRELEGQFRDHFDPAAVAGKDVLDFGCGEGDLGFIVASMSPKSIVGVDVDADRVASARSRIAGVAPAVTPKFEAAATMDTIDLPDASVDLLLCFDVLEHILDYESILPEWARVLRPGGRVMIWWVPWYHPYGHHIESLVPLPWAHAVFSDRALLETCARIYDMDGFEPRIWDLDEDGNKRPNKWRGMTELPDVNKLTMRRFESICRRIGLRITRRELHGFGSSGLARLTHAFTRVPLLREYFTAYTIYELEKPASTAPAS